MVLTTGTASSATLQPTRLRLLGFDAATGVVWQKAEWELPSGTGTGRHAYSGEFSHSGDYVYATKIFSGGRLYRYDVASNTSGAAIKASEANIGSIGTNGGQVKRAPDGKMYVANANGNALSVVADPDNSNPASVGFSSLGFTLPPGSLSRFGLPQLVTGCPIPPESDLEVVKTADPTSLEIGDDVTFTLEVSNDGPDDSSAVTLTDVLPAGLTHVSDDAGCNTTAAPTITCQLGALASGASRTVEIVARVGNGASDQTLENTATVSGPNVDPEPEDNESSASIDVGSASDLALTKSAGPAVVDPGQQITFTLVATNNGPDDEAAATIVDTLPAGLNYVSNDSSCDTGSLPQITCNLGALADGANRTVQIVVEADAGAAGTFPVNTATVSGDGTDINQANNTDDAEVRVRPYADLALEKSAAPTIADPDGNVTYTLTVSNNGTNDSPSATVTDTLPGGVTYASDDAGCATTLPQITCPVPAITAGGSQTIHVTVTVNGDAGNTTQTNAASVTGPLSDPEPDNNDDSANIFVTPVSDLSVTKSAPPTIRASQQLTYTLAYANAGPTASPAPTTITDTLPDEVTYVSDNGGCDTTNVPQISCEVGPLASGATGEIQVVVQVASSARGDMTNTAEIAGPNTDPDPANNEDDAATAIGAPSADLRIEKTVDEDLVNPGGAVVYTLTVTNDGPDVAPQVVVTDPLPGGLEPGPAPAGCTYDDSAREYTCDAGDIPSGETREFEISASVADSAGGSVQDNTATVDGAGDDPDPTNNESSATVLVPPLSDLSLQKDVSAATIRAGQQLTYTLVWANDGPTDSGSTVVTDTLPAGVTYVSDDAGCDDGALPQLSCDLGTVPSGADGQIEIVVTVDGATRGEIENSASISGTNDDHDPSDNEDSATTDVTAPISDLELVKTAPAGPFAVGDQIPYTLTVTNNGPDGSPGTTVTDNLPAGLTYVSDDAGCDASAQPRIECDLGLIANGDSETVHIVTRVSAANGASVSNSATVRGGNPDPDPDDASASAVAGLIATATKQTKCFYGAKVTILGTNRPDRIVGTPGRDVINGRSGNDTIIGLAGNDLICGGAGNDLIKGGRGDDRVKGSTGDDRIFGNLGDDWLRGAQGDDVITGRQGNDKLMGNNGDDRLRGRSGNDELRGGPGVDWGNGGPGRDRGFSLETALSVNPCVNC
jgi:uncharacterized repeat protein (TIGR01451 family)